MSSIQTMGIQARAAARILRTSPTSKKNELLYAIAEALDTYKLDILAANAEDIRRAREAGIKESLVERLSLNEKNFSGMISGLHDVAALDDPVGRTDSAWRNYAGLEIAKKRIPIGVIGIIYESRPNVTIDAAALCLKTGNAVILKGGSDALATNMALMKAVKEGLSRVDLPSDAVQLVESTDRSLVKELLEATEYVDCVIPRGGAGLIQFVVQNSKVPVIETGAGNCHIFVDEGYDIQNASDIIVNAKVQRPGACNAVETVLIHKDRATTLIPMMTDALLAQNVTLFLSESAMVLLTDTQKSNPAIHPATEDDWKTEYLDFKLAVKLVDDVAEAVDHIEKYSTGHSESILTDSYHHAQYFLENIDSSAVYVNASTRFTDGAEFGFGAEIGISTQKLHARGPMGLEALTSIKYVILGDGQIRK